MSFNDLPLRLLKISQFFKNYIEQNQQNRICSLQLILIDLESINFQLNYENLIKFFFKDESIRETLIYVIQESTKEIYNIRQEFNDVKQILQKSLIQEDKTQTPEKQTLNKIEIDIQINKFHEDYYLKLSNQQIEKLQNIYNSNETYETLKTEMNTFLKQVLKYKIQKLNKVEKLICTNETIKQFRQKLEQQITNFNSEFSNTNVKKNNLIIKQNLEKINTRFKNFMHLQHIHMIQDMFNYFDNLIGIGNELSKNLEEYLELIKKQNKLTSNQTSILIFSELYKNSIEQNMKKEDVKNCDVLTSIPYDMEEFRSFTTTEIKSSYVQEIQSQKNMKSQSYDQRKSETQKDIQLQNFEQNDCMMCQFI